MAYTVKVFSRTGAPIAPQREIEAPTYKSALVAAKVIDGREGGFCTIHGPSGQFITSTQEETTEGTDDEFRLG